MNNYVVFDVETGPLPDSEIERIAPPFDPDSVKVGNLGLEKSMQKINAAKGSHFAGIKRSAALKAEYGEVLAIGWKEILSGKQPVTTIVMEKPEKKLLQEFWDVCDKSYHDQVKFVGFNIFAFDLPFLVRRSIINSVTVPMGLLPKNNRYWPDHFIDLMQRWQCGQYKDMISLDRFAKALGHSGKNASGANFAKTLNEDAVAAAEYLIHDLDLTQQVAEGCFSSFQ